MSQIKVKHGQILIKRNMWYYKLEANLEHIKERGKNTHTDVSKTEKEKKHGLVQAWGYTHTHRQTQPESRSHPQERTRSADIATELLRTEGSEEVAAAALVRETSLTSFVASPSKHDKKVTFAKLLDKMSKEMSSSSSDMSCTEEKSPSRIFSLGGARRSPRRSPRIRHTQRWVFGAS